MKRETILDKIIYCYDNLTKQEARLADYILAHRQTISYLTISELADSCNVANSTITRFVQKVDCSNFREFKLEVMKAIQPQADGTEENDTYSELLPEDSIPDKCRKLCAIDVEALTQTMESISAEQISGAVDMLLKANRVFCCGVGNSSIVAMDAWVRFSAISNKFTWIPDSHIQVTTAASLDDNDVVLYYSFSGTTRELETMSNIMGNSKGKFIIVTRYPNSIGAENADIVLLCGASESPKQQGSIAAKLSQLFVTDILYNEYFARDLKTCTEKREQVLAASLQMHI